jgi:cytochrome c-type biogenesis protein CcmE
MKPKGFKEAALKIGQKVTARGELKPSFLEANRVIEVHGLNGTKLKDDHKEKPKHKKLLKSIRIVSADE